MLSAYERRLILSYLSNALLRLRSRDEEARNLLRWLRKHEDQLEIPYPLTAGDDAEEAVGRKLPDEEVPTLEWRRVGKALRNALAAARQARPDRTARRLRRLAKTTRLSRTDTAVLELVLRASTGSLVGSMIEDIGDSRHWSGRFFRLGNPVLPCLLGLSAGAVYGRFAPDAPLVTSGLVSIDDDGDVTLIDRLTRLHWLPKEAGSDVQHLLLDEASPSELRWSDFDHVADDRDHLERLLRGALPRLFWSQGQGRRNRSRQHNQDTRSMSQSSPIDTADAFGGVLVRDDGKILLREPKGHYGGYVWTFPKGRADVGERATEAALREVHEETGYRARITGRLPGVFKGDTSTTVFFLMEPVGTQGLVGAETATTVWVDLKQAKALVSLNKTAAGRARDLNVINAVAGQGNATQRWEDSQCKQLFPRD